ncbi:MAG TPA: hypothetical protein VLV83_07195 [Acidobacteriota bacterium]|nr:hypothetical protein [Acidobacteriota bacterium]
MIIEDLIRTGRLLQSALTDQESLQLISDAAENNVKNFYQHVFVVEIPPEDSGSLPAALPMQRWGQDVVPEGKKKARFEPDLKRALGAPVVYPKGGNPINPQGIYGNPAFLVFDRHFGGFRQGAEQVRDFLQRRLDRCPRLSLSSQFLEHVVEALHARVAEALSDAEGKTLGIVLLADVDGEESAFRWADYSPVAVGNSMLSSDKYLVPRHSVILQRFWLGKLAEGADGGRRTGACTICGKGDGVISSYSKAWPWYLPEWRCPLPRGGQRKLMVESIALDEGCYRALTVGACFFNKRTRRLHHQVTREVFSPEGDGQARQIMARKSLSDFPVIYGAALMLPLLGGTNDRSEASQAITDVLLKEHSGGQLVQHLGDVTGFELGLPEKVTDRFRLNLLYFSGQPSRGDIHLRAVIEDLLPSALRAVVGCLRPLADAAHVVFQALYPHGSQKQKNYFRQRTRLLPYLLSRGYGGAYVWDQLERTLRRQRLGFHRPVRNAARRMATLASTLPESENQLREEVFFFLVLLDFISLHNQGTAEGGESNKPMKHWKELLAAVQESPPEQMDTALSGPPELGFACGVLVRRFSRQYWQVTKTGREGKDYLKHRVVTFGASLTPEVLWKRGLPQIFDLETRLQTLTLNDDFRQRLGVILNSFERSREEVRAQRDGFMAGFWSGYALQGAAGSASSEGAESNESQPKEEST